VPSPERQKIKLEQLSLLVLSHTPLGRLVRWVAGIRASVHTKLLVAFLVVTLLFVAMALVSFQTLVSTTRQGRLLDEAHERVAWAHQIEQALARQMHFTVLALLSQDEVAIEKILRENNRFNNLLAKIESGETPELHPLIEQIRSSQDDAMAVVADMANAIRDGKLGGASVRSAWTSRSRSASHGWWGRSRTAWRGCATASPLRTARRSC
jgi:hypothetical protein